MHHHHLPLVLLSLLVAVFGSWTALDLFRRVRSHIGQARRVWLGAAALAMGASIWSMHFVAMLGFDPGSPTSYDLPLTFLSLALAIAATSGAFFAAAAPGAPNRRLVAAGVVMGAGICLMHYVGMAALRTAVTLGYQPGFVVASFVIAAAASTAALFVARREQSLAWRGAAALTLGVAIAGMHYTAMAGLRLGLDGAMQHPGHLGAPPYVLGVSVAAGTVVILLLALMASLYDQRLNVLLALEAGDVGYWELSLPDRTLHMSPRGRMIFGRGPDQPFTHDELLNCLRDDERARRDQLFGQALAQGGAYDAEYELKSDGGAPRWVNVRSRVMSMRAGAPRRIGGVVLDVTERRRAFASLAMAERRQRLLINELNHRVKNTLMIVQSIARQTAKQAGSLDLFREDFEGRLVSLSKAHSALTRGGWETASLRELLGQELSPYSAQQARMEGPDVHLRPRQTVALGMIFHELATNAAKYGALSTPAGCVQVRWEEDAAANALNLTWTEKDGPSVTTPSATGFGSRLIRSTVEGDLKGVAALDYLESGFECRLVVPLAGEGEDGAPGSPEAPWNAI